MAITMEKRIFNKTGYLLYKQPGPPGELLPLLVYLHGSDGCGSDPKKLLDIESIPYYLERGEFVPGRGMIVLAPQCPSGKRWSDMADAVIQLIEHICASEGADTQRVALTGASLGGMGTFSIAIRYPGRFSCLVPVCANVDPKACTVLTQMPIRIFHGELDSGMGFSVVEADKVINAAGGDSQLTMLQGEGHEIRWIYTAPQFDIINWMLEQKKAPIVSI